MGALDADIAKPAVHGKRFVVLTDLVVLRLVGIEVLLSVEDRARRDLALQRCRDHQRGADRLLIGRRERARMTQANRAGVGVRLVAEGRRAAAEHLGPGESWTWISSPMTASYPFSALTGPTLAPSPHPRRSSGRPREGPSAERSRRRCGARGR